MELRRETLPSGFRHRFGLDRPSALRGSTSCRSTAAWRSHRHRDSRDWRVVGRSRIQQHLRTQSSQPRAGRLPSHPLGLRRTSGSRIRAAVRRPSTAWQNHSTDRSPDCRHRHLSRQLHGGDERLRLSSDPRLDGEKSVAGRGQRGCNAAAASASCCKTPHTFTVRSSLADARRFPSALNATLVTQSVCPFKVSLPGVRWLDTALHSFGITMLMNQTTRFVRQHASPRVSDIECRYSKSMEGSVQPEHSRE